MAQESFSAKHSGPPQWSRPAFMAMAAAVAAAALIWLQASPRAAAADVGDCMTVETHRSLKLVDCASPDAALKIAQRVPAGWPAAASAAQCSSVGEKLAGQAFWRDIDSGNGYILCLVAES